MHGSADTYRELSAKDFRIKEYRICSPKIEDGRELCFALLSDLHGLVYGRENQILYDAVMSQRPDAVLISGDMLVRRDLVSLEHAERLLGRLAGQTLTVYSPGNHETRMAEMEQYRERMQEYEKTLGKQGVFYLHNEKVCRMLRGTKCNFYGLEVPLSYYRKPRAPFLEKGDMEKLLGKPEEDGYQILLAHSPKYGKTYFQWGADLTVSGHYHGGMLRFGEHVGAISPQFRIFPPYCCGDFHNGEKCMIVSAGIGEHSIPLRLHNPRELLMIRVRPEPNRNKRKNNGNTR